MPAPKPVAAAPALYRELSSATAEFGENRDCAVKAVAAVAEVEYAVAHETLAKVGRQHRKGTYDAEIRSALRLLGFECERVPSSEFIAQYPKAHQVLKSVTTHHPDRFPKVWGGVSKALLFTSGHVSAVVDGELVDWARGKAKRVNRIWIVKPE